ncbi:MAG: NfeD family protein [bacterium]
MDYWHYWLSAGIILLVLEMIVPGFFLFSFGVSCIITGLVAYIGLNLLIQVLVFCVSSFVIFFSLRPVVQKYFSTANHEVITGPAALIGKKGRVTIRIENTTNSGRVNVEGEDWKALSLSGESIEEGEIIEVLNIESINLIVGKAVKGE